MKVDVDEVDQRALPRLRADKGVLAVAPAMPIRLIEPRAVSGPLTAAGDTTAAALPEAWGIRAVGADTSPFTGSGVVVAVLDTGIDAAHPAFAGVTLVTKNFTNAADHDTNGHGTHCAGTIFGRDVNGRRIGVARGVTKALIGKVLGAGGGSSEQIASAIQWALDGGADVISMSLGIDFPGYVRELQQSGFDVAPATSLALEGYRANVQLFERLASFVEARGAFAQSSLIVAAAGNESHRDGTPAYDIAASPPAVAPGIVSVAALGQGENGYVVAPFSNTGALVSGPGVDILSAFPDGELRLMSGTSMATPHVAGVAALWAEKLRVAHSLTGAFLHAELVAAATRAGLDAGFEPFEVGKGMVQAPQS